MPRTEASREVIPIGTRLWGHTLCCASPERVMPLQPSQPEPASTVKSREMTAGYRWRGAGGLARQSAGDARGWREVCPARELSGCTEGHEDLPTERATGRPPRVPTHSLRGGEFQKRNQTLREMVRKSARKTKPFSTGNRPFAGRRRANGCRKTQL